MNQPKTTNDLTAENQIRAYLESYLFCNKMLSSNHYAKSYIGAASEDATAEADNTLLKAKMFAVRSFIMHLPDCREKMFLYHRYLNGYSMEKCAELMGVSRRSAFRIAGDALRLASENFSAR